MYKMAAGFIARRPFLRAERKRASRSSPKRNQDMRQSSGHSSSNMVIFSYPSFLTTDNVSVHVGKRLPEDDLNASIASKNSDSSAVKSWSVVAW